MIDLLLSVGLGAIIEGPALALASLRLEQVFDLLHAIGAENLRMIAVLTFGAGAGLIWLARR